MWRNLAAALVASGVLLACSPTHDWREVRTESAHLKALFPCKPERATRLLPIDGRDVSLRAMACETGGATFAVFEADLGDPALAGRTLMAWNAATLARLRAPTSSAQPFRPEGALDIPSSLQVTASGQRPAGEPVQSQAAYFASGAQVFQAVIYAERIAPEVAESFFGGLRLE